MLNKCTGSGAVSKILLGWWILQFILVRKGVTEQITF